MTLGVDILSFSELRLISETPVFESVVMTETYAGSEKYMQTRELSDAEANRKFYWRCFRTGDSHPPVILYELQSRK